MKKILLFVALLLAFRAVNAQTDTAYVAETIPLPPGLTAEVGGLDFLPDGRLAVAFHRGEVMTYNPATKTWNRFAEGLHDPLGVLAVSNTELLVMQRPELTRVRDTNGDGRADEFSVVTDDFGISGNYHEFAFGPVRDRAGNLFIALNTASNGAGIRPELRGAYNPLGRQGRMYSCVPYRGWVLQLDKTGKVTPFALGFRSPNSLGFDAAGRLLVCDNQGDWLGTSKLYHVEKGQFYGHPTSLVWKAGFPTIDPLELPVSTLDSMRTRESVAFPHGYVANSPTQPVPDATGGKFGPFAGQVFVGEMDHPFLLRVLLEDVDGATQGAVLPFPVRGLRRGNNRLAFAPDGSLWVGQTTHGWVGA
jgi:glucose/arabinose dehydrogenase